MGTASGAAAVAAAALAAGGITGAGRVAGSPPGGSSAGREGKAAEPADAASPAFGAAFGCAAGGEVDEEHVSALVEAGAAKAAALVEEYGWASDIWAFGITALEMMTGGKPLFSDWLSAWLRLCVVATPLELPSTLSPLAADFLSHCLAIKPEERWRASELLTHPFLYDESFGDASSMAWSAGPGASGYGSDASLPVDATAIAGAEASFVGTMPAGLPLGSPATPVRPPRAASARAASMFATPASIAPGGSGGGGGAPPPTVPRISMPVLPLPDSLYADGTATVGGDHDDGEGRDSNTSVDEDATRDIPTAFDEIPTFQRNDPRLAGQLHAGDRR